MFIPSIFSVEMDLNLFDRSDIRVRFVLNKDYVGANTREVLI